MFRGKKIVVGVCGGIAAYKICLLIRDLKRLGAEVKVVMTSAATQFIAPLTFSTLSGNEVYISMFPENSNSNTSLSVNHINLSLWADIIFVAPATANTIAKLANGFADNLLTSIILASRCPVLIAPSMDVDMYENTITQENLSRLKSRGLQVIEPDTGELASGLQGKGRLPNTKSILYEIEKILTKKDFLCKNILISAGPTQEMIDPVRFISNKSSGKMGYSIAKAAALRGGCVTLISGPVNQETLKDVDIAKVNSADEMFNEIKSRYNKYDIIIMSAAVADYKPYYTSTEKIKKGDSTSFSLDLTINQDILEYLGKNKKQHFLVGFAVETSNEIENAKNKLVRKNLDMIIVNNPLIEGAGFDVDTNIITILSSNGKVEKYEKQPKFDLANIILDKIIELAK